MLQCLGLSTTCLVKDCFSKINCGRAVVLQQYPGPLDGWGVAKSGGLRLYPSLSDHKAAHKATTWISYSSVTEPNLVMIVFIIFVIVEWLLVTLWSKLTNRTIGSFMTVSNQQVSGRYYMYLAECRSWKSGYMYVKEACTTVNFLWHIFGFHRAVGLCIIPVNA